MPQQVDYKINLANIMMLNIWAGAQHKFESAKVEGNLKIKLIKARNNSEFVVAQYRSGFGLAGNKFELASAKNRSVGRKLMLAAGLRWLAE